MSTLTLLADTIVSKQTVPSTEDYDRIEMMETADSYLEYVFDIDFPDGACPRQLMTNINDFVEANLSMKNTFTSHTVLSDYVLGYGGGLLFLKSDIKGKVTYHKV